MTDMAKTIYEYVTKIQLPTFLNKDNKFGHQMVQNNNIKTSKQGSKTESSLLQHQKTRGLRKMEQIRCQSGKNVQSAENLTNQPFYTWEGFYKGILDISSKPSASVRSTLTDL